MQKPPDWQSRGLSHGSPNAAVPAELSMHSLCSQAYEPPHEPLNGPDSEPLTHCELAPHHPQPETGVHVLHVWFSLQGSVVVPPPPQSLGSHVHDAPPHVDEPLEPPLWQVLLSEHQPQPAFGVQPPHDVKALHRSPIVTGGPASTPPIETPEG